jgi:purine-binding chemotaxis protein CheW
MSPSILETAPTADVLDIEAAFDAVYVPRTIGPARFVTFYYGNNLYGIAAGEVAEVTRPLPITPLPNGPEFLSGISPLRGEIIAVLDLCGILGEPAVKTLTASKFIVLKSRDNDSQPGFRVDRVHELASLSQSEISIPSESDGILAGTADLGGQAIKLIRASALRSAIGS